MQRGIGFAGRVSSFTSIRLNASTIQASVLIVWLSTLPAPHRAAGGAAEAWRDAYVRGVLELVELGHEVIVERQVVLAALVGVTAAGLLDLFVNGETSGVTGAFADEIRH